MTTIKPIREEALRAGYRALAGRIHIDYEKFSKALESWDVKAFCKGEDVVGMLMVKDGELHVAIVPEARGKWLSRRLIREVIGPLVKEYGAAKTKVMPDNRAGSDFVRRIGFAKSLKDDVLILREGFESRYFDPISAAAAVVGGTNLVGSFLQYDAANNAADQQANAAANSLGLQQQMFNTINSQNQPWREAGAGALGQINDMLPQFTHTFNAADLNSNLAPNYQFQLDQGLGAVKNAGNLQTGLLSGNTLKGINDYAQNFAGNSYQQAFNNYNAQQSNIFNRLSNIAGLGQTANQTTAGAGVQTAGNAGNAALAGGAAQAAGTIGAANALSGGLTNAGSWYALPSFLKPQGGSTPWNPYQNYAGAGTEQADFSAGFY